MENVEGEHGGEVSEECSMTEDNEDGMRLAGWPIGGHELAID